MQVVRSSPSAKETEVAGAYQLYKAICDSDSDEYRGPDSSSKGEGGWEGEPGVSLQTDRIVTSRTSTNEHLPIKDKTETPRHCPLLEVSL
jgi:hypothetical protein